MLGSPSFWTNLWVFSVTEEKYVIVMIISLWATIRGGWLLGGGLVY